MFEAGSEGKTQLSAWVKAMAAMKLIEPDSPKARVPATRINHHLYDALDSSRRSASLLETLSFSSNHCLSVSPLSLLYLGN